jgi:hypothetical protein
MLPHFKLAMIFAKMAKDHGHKVLHINNIELLTKDLGNALKEQQKILQSPNQGAAMTAYDLLPVIAEVKLLTMAVSSKLGIDTKGKSAIVILEEIVAKTEARGSKSAKDVQATLEWTRAFFAHPEIQEILKADLIEIQKPKGWRDIGKTASQTTQRIAQELSRLTDFLKKAKEIDVKKEDPKKEDTKKDGPKGSAP